jgi:hypothetical protein
MLIGPPVPPPTLPPLTKYRQTRLSDPGSLPPNVRDLAADPRLQRHIYFNTRGEVVNARLCHDLFSLPYDRKDIGTVPFHRVYKREKLVLMDNPVTRTIHIRQSLTNVDKNITTTTAEILTKSVARIKRIYAGNNPARLDRGYDEQKASYASSIYKSLPNNHSFRNRRKKAGKDELIEWAQEIDKVRDLEGWERKLQP